MELDEKISELAESSYMLKPAKQDKVGGLVEAEEIPKRGMDKDVEGTQ